MRNNNYLNQIEINLTRIITIYIYIYIYTYIYIYIYCNLLEALFQLFYFIVLNYFILLC